MVPVAAPNHLEEHHRSVTHLYLNPPSMSNPQGYNAQGQLGDATTTNRNLPTQVYFGGYWVAVSAGYSHTCAIRSDLSLWCWVRAVFRHAMQP